MWSTLVDLYSCRNQSLFFNQSSFNEILNLAFKNLKALKFDKIRLKKRTHRSQATALGAGRFEFQKRSGFLKGERGRQAVVYMEGVMIVGLVSFHLFPMYK